MFVRCVECVSDLPRDAYFAMAERARQWRKPFAGHLPKGVTAEEARSLTLSDAARRALLPGGLRDGLPPDAAQRAQVIERLIAEFTAHGYERVEPPLVEFEESLLAGGEIYGFPGILVALPLLAALRAMWEFFSERVVFQKWTDDAPLAEIGVEAQTEDEATVPERPRAPAA